MNDLNDAQGIEWVERPPRIGDQAPDFTARSTQGELTLSQFRGRWVMLLSHPADFTPVCTSEFIALAGRFEQFTAMGCQLVGLSVDSLASHLAWLEAIRRQFEVVVPFPIVEDPSMAVARAYGMLDKSSNNTANIRAVHVIDPDGVIQAVLSYPVAVGRSVAELLRLLAALQRVGGEALVTPEGWMPGEKLLRGPAESLQDIESRGPAWLLAYCEEKPSGGERR